MTLGENLQRLRKAQGLSQDEVAQNLFLSRQSVSKWENDGAEPGVENLKALSRLYGVTIDELVDNVREKDEELFQPDDLFQVAVMVRLMIALYGICFVSGQLLGYCWELPLLFAGFRFRNRLLWGATLLLEGTSLFVHLIFTAKAFLFWDYYETENPFQWLFLTAGIALTFILLLQKKTRKYFHGE